MDEYVFNMINQPPIIVSSIISSNYLPFSFNFFS